jgi:hypothetical protein
VATPGAASNQLAFQPVAAPSTTAAATAAAAAPATAAATAAAGGGAAASPNSAASFEEAPAAIAAASSRSSSSSSSSSSSQFAAFLVRALCSEHGAGLQREGFREAADLRDADDDDLFAAGLKKPEIRRLRRYLEAEAAAGRL